MEKLLKDFEDWIPDMQATSAIDPRLLDENEVKKWVIRSFEALRNQTIEECMKALEKEYAACSSGMCGHKNLEPNSVEHGRYIGRNKAIKESQSNLLSLKS